MGQYEVTVLVLTMREKYMAMRYTIMLSHGTKIRDEGNCLFDDDRKAMRGLDILSLSKLHKTTYAGPMYRFRRSCHFSRITCEGNSESLDLTARMSNHQNSVSADLPGSRIHKTRTAMR